MSHRSALATVAAISAAALGIAIATASAAPQQASLLIRHQVRGCHTWSVNGGPFKPSQSLTLQRGGSLKVTNNDVMPHTLVKTSGPSVRMTNLNSGMMGMGMHRSNVPGAMTHMGASTKVVFSKTGVYRFMTRAGEDYMEGMKTIGEDNVLHLKVTVS
jgi:plastocyanin